MLHTHIGLYQYTIEMQISFKVALSFQINKFHKKMF